MVKYKEIIMVFMAALALIAIVYLNNHVRSPLVDNPNLAKAVFSVS